MDLGMEPSTKAISQNQRVSEQLARASTAIRRVGWILLAISSVINVLSLTGAIYMLQIYDRVLTSHSVETLIVLTVLIVGLYLIQGVLDTLRAQILVRAGLHLDRHLKPLAHDAALALPLAGVSAADATQPMRDLETIRHFFERLGPVALLDLPWMPIYLAFVFYLHPVLGITATLGLCVLVIIAAVNERKVQAFASDLLSSESACLDLAAIHARQAETLHAFGLQHQTQQSFLGAQEKFSALQSRASDLTSTSSSISKVFRGLLQSLVLGIGAYLTLQGEITAGAIIAASITTSRAFAPAELAMSHWKSFVLARHGYKNFLDIVTRLPTEPEPIELPPPQKNLTVEKISIATPKTNQLILRDVAFSLNAGEALGVVGPSGSGKSTLVRALVGIWPCARGTIRLDSATLQSWSATDRGRHIGHLSQQAELFDASVAQNISRLAPTPDTNAIIQAAQDADVHEMILRFPNGYETQVGPNGCNLSAGQRQRIALARALYNNPFLVVLDEPNANLDAAGDAALRAAMQRLKARGAITVIVAHRPSALAEVNKILVLENGKVTGFGDAETILKKILPPQTQTRIA